MRLKEVYIHPARVKYIYCCACGDALDPSPSIRKYRPQDCKHLILQSLQQGGVICTRCYNWDYNVHVRNYHPRKSLRLRDGRHLVKGGDWFRYDNSSFFV